jgi:sortase A
VGSLRRVARLGGTALIVAGTLGLGWVLLVWQWQDPFTALYTHREQARLGKAYEHRAIAFASHARVSPGASRSRIALLARRYRASLAPGDPIGRLDVGRLGLDMVVVQGTDPEPLRKGPGHYVGSYLPGQGELVYIAGHRTTYLAPFAHIDRLEAGDRILFELPYGTFLYRVTGHRVVPADDLDVLRSRHREQLILQACHPRFFASHRYLVYAQLRSYRPPGSAS